MKQPFTITLDPRVHISQSDLEAQLLAGKRVDAGLAASAKVFNDITNLRNSIADRLKTLGPVPGDKAAAENAKDKDQDAQASKLAGAAAAAPDSKSPSPAVQPPPAGNPAKDSADALEVLEKKAEEILQGTVSAPGVAPINRDLARVQFFVQSGDSAPSPTAKAVLDESCDALNKNVAAWRDLDSQSVPATSKIIAKSSLAALPTATVMSIMAMPHDTVSANACAP
jgi:hypothetical protein